MQQTHLLVGISKSFFSERKKIDNIKIRICYIELEKIEIPNFSNVGGRTTTCMVITPPGSSSIGNLDSASVRLFSSIFPPFISFKSFIVFGAFVLSVHNKSSLIHSILKSLYNVLNLVFKYVHTNTLQICLRTMYLGTL